MHINIVNFFLRFIQSIKNVPTNDNLRMNVLEDRAETWDYLDQKLIFSSEEKLKYYQENCVLLNNFGSIVSQINQNVPEAVLDGCRKMVRLLNIMSVVTDPQERFDIAP